VDEDALLQVLGKDAHHEGFSFHLFWRLRKQQHDSAGLIVPKSKREETE